MNWLSLHWTIGYPGMSPSEFFKTTRKFRIYAFLLSILLCSWGCNWLAPATSEMDTAPYYQKIKQWQDRIKKEGWTAEIIDDVINSSRRLTRYEMEFGDDWLTPKDFARVGMHGDCEDIAIFMMSSLKQLRYPHTVRVLVIRHLFADHAQLKVELPDHTWKWYESTRERSYLSRPAVWQPIVEFDENTIVYHALGEDSRIAAYP